MRACMPLNYIFLYSRNTKPENIGDLDSASCKLLRKCTLFPLFRYKKKSHFLPLKKFRVSYKIKHKVSMRM